MRSNLFPTRRTLTSPRSAQRGLWDCARVTSQPEVVPINGIIVMWEPSEGQFPVSGLLRRMSSIEDRSTRTTKPT
jgi:hypothetical protein